MKAILTHALLAILATGCGAPVPAGAVSGATPLPAASSAVARHPCEVAAHMFAALDLPVTVDVYLPPPVATANAGLPRIEEVLGAYKATAQEKLSFRMHPARSDGFTGLVVRQGREQVEIKDAMTVAPESWRLGIVLMGSIRDLDDQRAHRKRRIGVLVGHGELGLRTRDLVPALTAEERGGGPSLQQIFEQDFPAYQLVDVDLKGGTAPIDDTLAGVLVTQPRAALNDAELRALDGWVMRGKALAVLASSVNVAPGDTDLRLALDAHGLDRLLAGYGVDLERNLVLDLGAPLDVPIQTSSGVLHGRYAQFVDLASDLTIPGDQAGLDRSSLLFFHLDELMVPFASSLVLHRERQPRARISVIAQSSARAVLETEPGVPLGMSVRIPRVRSFQQVDLAVTVTGALTSAFSSASTPSGRILVVSSSELLANPFALALFESTSSADARPLHDLGEFYAKKALTSTILVLKDIVDWMSDDGALLARCVPAREHP